MTGKLLIARHHESEWNKKGLWTGSRNVHLTPYGVLKSEEMGLRISDIRIDRAFTSKQARAIETLAAMLKALKLDHLPIEHVHALNERDYGDYTGKNKWDMEQLVGADAFEAMRRGWDYPIPNGETLKTVYERVVPFYIGTVVPLLAAGENVLIVSHGNALRALMIYLESIPEEKVADLNMLFGAVVIYSIDATGRMLEKEVRQIESAVNA